MPVFFDSITFETRVPTSTTWVNITSDVKLDPRPRGDRGIQGDGPTDFVEDPGTLTFSVDDSAKNSQATAGYYSAAGSPVSTGYCVRVGFTYGGRTRYKWAGFITATGFQIHTEPLGERRVDVTAQTWFGLINTYDLDFIDHATNIRIDQAVTLILAELPELLKPQHTQFATGEYTFPDVFDLTNGETKVVGEFQKLAQSEGGRIYSRSNTQDGLTLCVDSIHTRQSAGLTQYALPDSQTTDKFLLANGVDNLRLANGTDELLLVMTDTFEFTDADLLNNGKFTHSWGKNYYSHVKASVVPRRVDAAATTVLWTMESPLLVAAGTTVSGIRGRYRDPAGGASYVNGIEMVRPAGTTDYRAFANSDGTGTEYTSSCLVTADFGTAEVEFSIENTGSNDFYVGGSEGSAIFQVRGKGVYAYDAVDIIFDSGEASPTAGRNLLTVEFPYQSDPIEVQRLIQLTSYAESMARPFAAIEAFPMRANDNETMMRAWMGLCIGDKVTVSLDSFPRYTAPSYINSYSWEIVDGKYVDWEPHFGFNYFIQ